MQLREHGGDGWRPLIEPDSLPFNPELAEAAPFTSAPRIARSEGPSLRLGA